MVSEAEWLACVHPDDRTRAQKEVGNALEGRAPYDTEYRIVHANGEVRWVSSKAKVFFDAGEEVPVRMIGAIADITRQKRAEVALGGQVAFQNALLQVGRAVPTDDAARASRGGCSRVQRTTSGTRCVICRHCRASIARSQNAYF